MREREYYVYVALIDGTKFDAFVFEHDLQGLYAFLDASDSVKSYSTYNILKG